jgi:hypothetical protein
MGRSFQLNFENDIGRSFLLGNRKKIARLNENFYIPLYLPLCLLPLFNTKIQNYYTDPVIKLKTTGNKIPIP